MCIYFIHIYIYIDMYVSMLTKVCATACDCGNQIEPFSSYSLNSTTVTTPIPMLDIYIYIHT